MITTVDGAAVIHDSSLQTERDKELVFTVPVHNILKHHFVICLFYQQTTARDTHGTYRLENKDSRKVEMQI